MKSIGGTAFTVAARKSQTSVSISAPQQGPHEVHQESNPAQAKSSCSQSSMTSSKSFKPSHPVCSTRHCARQICIFCPEDISVESHTASKAEAKWPSVKRRLKTAKQQHGYVIKSQTQMSEQLSQIKHLVLLWFRGIKVRACHRKIHEGSLGRQMS